MGTVPVHHSRTPLRWDSGTTCITEEMPSEYGGKGPEEQVTATRLPVHGKEFFRVYP